MTCDRIREQLPLFLYGELTFDEEERLEGHFNECAACRQALEREKAIHAAVDSHSTEPPPALVVECRSRLRDRIAAETARPGWSWSRRLGQLLWPAAGAAWMRPAGAVALIAIGFFGARLSSVPVSLRLSESTPDPLVASRVRYLEPDRQGRIRIGLEETRRREVSGSVEESRIRHLLMAAARDPNDPGLRVESVDLLRSESATAEVRRALLQALQSDPNAGVRLKALEGIRRFAGQPEVRSALAQVLLSDDNPGVRTQVVELLVEQNSREMAGTFQELLRKEDNDYIRFRSQRALQAMKASLDTF